MLDKNLVLEIYLISRITFFNQWLIYKLHISVKLLRQTSQMFGQVQEFDSQVSFFFCPNPENRDTIDGCCSKLSRKIPHQGSIPLGNRASVGLWSDIRSEIASSLTRGLTKSSFISIGIPNWGINFWLSVFKIHPKLKVHVNDQHLHCWRIFDGGLGGQDTDFQGGHDCGDRGSASWKLAYGRRKTYGPDLGSSKMIRGGMYDGWPSWGLVHSRRAYDDGDVSTAIRASYGFQVVKNGM